MPDPFVELLQAHDIPANLLEVVELVMAHFPAGLLAMLEHFRASLPVDLFLHLDLLVKQLLEDFNRFEAETRPRCDTQLKNSRSNLRALRITMRTYERANWFRLHSCNSVKCANEASTSLDFQSLLTHRYGKASRRLQALVSVRGRAARSHERVKCTFLGFICALAYLWKLDGEDSGADFDAWLRGLRDFIPRLRKHLDDLHGKADACEKMLKRNLEREEEEQDFWASIRS